MYNKGALPKWREKTITEKILVVIQMLVSVFVILFASLQLFNIWDKAINVVVPLLSVNMLLLFMQYRKYSRVFSLLCLSVSVFLFIGVLKILFIQYEI